tara:strand:- start:676 stop:861 length:186 start_codon:yes stop_codon:yes gene_type:complete
LLFKTRTLRERKRQEREEFVSDVIRQDEFDHLERMKRDDVKRENTTITTTTTKNNNNEKQQ